MSGYILRDDAVTIVRACIIAGQPERACALLADPAMTPRLALARLQPQGHDAGDVRPAATPFDPGLIVRVAGQIDLAGLETAARAAGRLR